MEIWHKVIPWSSCSHKCLLRLIPLSSESFNQSSETAEPILLWRKLMWSNNTEVKGTARWASFIFIILVQVTSRKRSLKLLRTEINLPNLHGNSIKRGYLLMHTFKSLMGQMSGLLISRVLHGHLPGEPYSWRGSLQILGITSIRVFTYCIMVPWSCTGEAEREAAVNRKPWIQTETHWSDNKISEQRKPPLPTPLHCHSRNRLVSPTHHHYFNCLTHQAFHDLQQLLHHHRDALVTQKSAHHLDVRGTDEIPVGAKYAAVRQVQGLRAETGEMKVRMNTER